LITSFFKWHVVLIRFMVDFSRYATDNMDSQRKLVNSVAQISHRKSPQKNDICGCISIRTTQSNTPVSVPFTSF